MTLDVKLVARNYVGAEREMLQVVADAIASARSVHHFQNRGFRT